MSASLRTRWFIRLFALWALVLALIAFASLLITTKIAELGGDQVATPAQIWTLFILQTGFGIAFATCAYGFWQYRAWGRILFLWTSTVWFGLNLLALFAPGVIFVSDSQYTTTGLILNGIRYIIALIIPLGYLNLAHVKDIFINSQNLATEEVTINDSTT